MQVLDIAPRWRHTLVAGRRFQERALRYLAESVGIDQFLDIGAGLPTYPVGHATHEVVNPRYITPVSRHRIPVVYVDNDPLCVAHGLAYWDNDTIRYLRGSILEPFELLNNPLLRARISLTRPVGVLVCGLLHHIPDRLKSAEIMRRLIDLLPAGSYIVITHYWAPEDDPEAHDMAVEVQRRHINGGLGSGWFRPREQIASYFPGLYLLPPGLVEPEDWWPAGPRACGRPPEERLMLAAVAHKPYDSETGG